MAKAKKTTETKIVVTGVTVELSEKEATALLTLLYRGISVGSLEALALRDLQSALFDARLKADSPVRFESTAHATAKLS